MINKTKLESRGKLHIAFNGEEGQDAGGLTREWFLLLSKELINPNIACSGQTFLDQRSYKALERGLPFFGPFLPTGVCRMYEISRLTFF